MKVWSSQPGRLQVLVASAAWLLAACGTAPGPGGNPAGAPLPPPPPPATNASPPVIQGPMLPPQGPVSPQAQQQAQKMAQGVADLLEAGNEEQARAELQRVLALDPANRLALNLQRQMNEDPVATLGRESFPYVVRGGDTLSRIAGRFLGDIYAFHILARYNNIKVPRQVGEGQTLRIPGRAPAVTASPPPPPRETNREPPAPPVAQVPPPPPPPPPPAVDPNVAAADSAFRSGQAAANSGALDKALVEYRRAAGLGHPMATAQAEAVSRRMVETYSRNARAATARQDLDGAIRAWDRVLEVDPDNETARLEKQKALRLKDKVKAL